MSRADSYLTPRCCLSVPGTEWRRFGKAVSSPADEVVFDLEDSVPPGAKTGARQTVVEWLTAETPPVVTTVRVNPTRSPWCHDDVIALAACGRADLSIVVPKAENAGDLAFIERLLDGAEAAAGRETAITVQALIESPAGLANLDEIVTATPRLRAVSLGYADLGAALGREAGADPGWWLPAQHQILVAARGAGVAAIDGPYLGVDDGEPFRDAVHRAAALGFDGKWVIHPRQADAVVRAFTPPADAVRHAKRVLAALDACHARGAGAVELDGQMIDEAVAVAARRTLVKAGETS